MISRGKTNKEISRIFNRKEEEIKNMIIDYYKNKTFNLVESHNKKQEVE
mgnify:CR=1 FL=1